MRKILWICLLTLVVTMSSFTLQGFTIAIPCCIVTRKPRKTSIGPIKACFEQHPRHGCPHAFLIITNIGKKHCLKPDLPWLKKDIKEGKLKCPPDISVKIRFEVLGEDDLE